MSRKIPQLEFATPDVIIERIDTLALINRKSKVVAWRKVVRDPAPNSEVGECVNELAKVWFGDTWNEYNLAILNLKLTDLLYAVGLLHDVSFMRGVVLPYAEDENGVVDSYQLLASVLLT